ncbi:MAG: hypothetical protein LUG49_06355 [Oscillospiraceae bacterium]|nr:hypothetical protein [Oscillospiraceae bacterium]
MAQARVNYSNPIEIRMAGYAALREALGPVGAIQFLQQGSSGSGDYTKEKYEQPQPTLDEIIAEIDATESGD